MPLFQSNLRKQIRNLPKIRNFVKKIHYYSELFTSLLRHRGRVQLRGPRPAHNSRLRPRGLRGGVLWRLSRRFGARCAGRGGFCLRVRSTFSWGYAGTADACPGTPIYRYRYTGIPVTQTLECPFSAVLKLVFATKGSFCRTFQALQDW